MRLNNEFQVGADLDRTWALLTDLERVMPCLPGASLVGRDGENYLGSVKIKVGPIGAHFTGSAHFASKDDDARVAVIAAAGKDAKGQATVSATIHARLEPVTPARTRVLIDTDLDISGRMAQFGRGAIADVGSRVLRQFADNISTQLLAAPAAPAASAAPLAPVPTPAPTPAPPPVPAPPVPAPAASAEDMDALRLVLSMIKERYGQAILGGVLGFLLSWLVFGRRAA
jgi:uncharacterized protein